MDEIVKEETEGVTEAPVSEEKKECPVKGVVKKLAKRWFIDAFSGMAQGLFCTLIAGTILAQIASWCGDNAFAHTLDYIAKIAKSLMGAGIGVGIANKLNAKPLVLFTAAVTGLVGAFASGLVDALVKGSAFALAFGAPGNPIGAYVLSLLTIEIAQLYVGKTKVDIVLVPLGMMILCLAGIFIAWPFIKLIELLGTGIALAIEAGVAVKIIVGVFVAVVMGILLTMPTSSAAIWIAITAAVSAEYVDALSIAGGAAVAGCAAHMIGFAVASFRENGVGGLISQGIGTSMLQIPNIMKKPIIMVPEIIASAVAGLVAVLLDLRCTPAGGGMGTSGLVGVFGAIDASQAASVAGWKIALGVILCLFVIPAGVSFAVSELFRKKGWISFGDQKLEA
ncbi:MAG: PTS sugar transporter subunit IIC [Clostridia bacterium]|nr:PTS sugar transporter subunit IIC [Clostridia bacterium]